MRTLKFRCYDKVNKEFVSLAYGTSLTPSELEARDKGDQYEITQWTGLTDKAGVEIYEGDIVEDSSSRYKIIYHTDGFYLHNIYEPENILLQLRHCYLLNTVIGNIYENKESY